MLVPESILHEAVSTLLQVHPYEEVAYDIYPLQNKGEEWGFGRIGKLRSPMSFDGFCEMVRDVLDVEDTRVVGDPEDRIETVALLGGSGGRWLKLAHDMGADAYVTGDVNHHQFVEAQAIGLDIIDATHFRTERPGMIALAPKLHDLLSSEGITVEYLDDVILQERA